MGWHLIANDKCRGMTRKEFMQILDFLSLAVSNSNQRRTIFEKLLPSLYNSYCSKRVIKGIKHKWFTYFFDAVILANIICIALDVTDAEAVFLGMFSGEIILKLYAYGVRRFFQRKWHIFDVSLVTSATVIFCYQHFGNTQIGSGVTKEILMVLRVIRIFKVFHNMKRFRIIINTLTRILPSMATYGVVIFLFYYSFAIIGMEIFSGKIRYNGYDEIHGIETDMYCGNSLLKNSTFYKDHYCHINFNDILTAFSTLFELMMVNQWHIIAEGHVLVTSKGARIFFILFHFVCVIVILNIFTSFVIEAFLLEYNQASSNSSSSSPAIEKIKRMGLDYKSDNPNESVELQDYDLDRMYNENHKSSKSSNSASAFEWEAAVSSGRKSKKYSESIDASLKTSIRFHTTKRRRTILEMLEKMCE